MKEGDEPTLAYRAISLMAELETQGLELYRTLAGLVSDNIAKQMFRKLAQDEEQHLGLIRRAEGELAGGLDVSRYELAEALGSSDSRPAPLGHLFRHANELVAATGELRCCSELDALGVSLVAELNSIRHLSDLLAATDSEEARSVYRRLLEEEKRHFEILARRAEQVFRSY
jgi:rubrerythrin